MYKAIINTMLLSLFLSLLSLQDNRLVQEHNQNVNTVNDISFIYRNQKIYIKYSDNTINI